MTALKGHFDGKVLVLDEPVNLPLNCALEVYVRPLDVSAGGEPPLQVLAALLARLPSDPDAPTDGAAQHDHHLYGTPRRS